MTSSGGTPVISQAPECTTPRGGPNPTSNTTQPVDEVRGDIFVIKIRACVNANVIIAAKN